MLGRSVSETSLIGISGPGGTHQQLLDRESRYPNMGQAIAKCLLWRC
jgi:hypothetical protein